MNAGLAAAIERLATATELQLEVTREQLASDRRREIAERNSRPEFLAEIEAVRRPLRKMSAQAFVRAAPWVFAESFDTVVPPEYFTQIDANTLLVACPCGTEHGVGNDGFPVRGDCGRYFLYDGRAMLVAFTPTTTGSQS